MELSLVNMLVLCVFNCFMLSPSFSLHIHISSPYRHLQVQVDPAPNADSGHDLLQRRLLLLPRKLKLAETATNHELGKGVAVNYKPKTSSFRSRVYKKGEGKKEKRGEAKEEEDKMSEFMGMDYAKARRRRPIHNKSYPTTSAP